MKIPVPRGIIRAFEWREEPYREWVTWYAWRPVVTLSGHLVWLEEIERRYLGFHDAGSAHDYRLTGASVTEKVK